jgi:competence protein ComEC
MYKNKNIILVVFLVLVGFDLFLWSQILFFKNEPKVYFLDVGQGDSSLVYLDNILFLVDAGPDKKVLQSLSRVFPKKVNYIDLAFISHPQLDHFGGFLDLLNKYDFGAFIINGREADDKTREIYNKLISKLEERKIPVITLSANDKIKYKNNLIEIISPDKNWIQSAELNDTSLVFRAKNPNFSILFTGDSGNNLLNYLSEKFDLKSNILKIPHHGSKYSFSENFLKAVSPNLALIGVGVKNSYNQPSKEFINGLNNLNIPFFRTDLAGNIIISFKNNNFFVRKER